MEALEDALGEGGVIQPRPPEAICQFDDLRAIWMHVHLSVNSSFEGEDSRRPHFLGGVGRRKKLLL